MPTGRKAQYPVLDLILHRWSARAMSGESITEQELFSLFEAARWAPSSYNNQPWRFIYAQRDTAEWEIFFNLIVAANQEWAQRAAALILVISHKNFYVTDKYSRTHSHDTGGATENLALQGSSMGLVVHGMEGFYYDRARNELQIPQEYDIEAMYAVGRPGSLEVLSPLLQGREVLSDRLPVKEIVYKGRFGRRNGV